MTQNFIQERLASLQNPAHGEAKKFSALYGDAHLQQVISWFEAALRDAK